MIRKVFAVAALATLLAGCGGSSPAATVTPSPAPSGAASPLPSATASPTPGLTATRTPLALPEVIGISTTPQWRPADEVRPLAPAPPSPFPEHDGESVVLYNIELGTIRNLGAGLYGTFTLDGRYMAWTDGAGDLWYVTLPDGDPVKLGKGGGLGAAGGPLIAAGTGPTGTLWDLSTETGTPGGVPPSGAFRDYQGSYFLVRDYSSGPLSFRVVSGMEPQFAATSALTASWAGPGEIVMASMPSAGISNIFLIDVGTATATFVATAGARLDAVGVAANQRWVAWTDDYCGGAVGEGAQGTTRVLDRSTGRIVDLGEALWPEGFTPDGRLRIGHGFGALSLVDLETWSYDILLPPGSVDVHWSPDYRYASRGMTLGHGGVCSY